MVKNNVMRQLKEVMAQSIPSVTCSCGLKTTLLYAYRCMECGEWYCKKCAKKHFQTPFCHNLLVVLVDNYIFYCKELAQWPYEHGDFTQLFKLKAREHQNEIAFRIDNLLQRI